MHTRRVKQLVKDLRNTKKIPPGNFDMCAYTVGNPLTHACNTSACVAGWTALHHKRQFLEYVRRTDIRIVSDGCIDGSQAMGTFAKHYLGLTNDQASELFFGGMSMTQFEKADWIEQHLLSKHLKLVELLKESTS